MAVILHALLFGSYFKHLVGEYLVAYARKQVSLEQIKAMAVPGSAFLKQADSHLALKSALFYLLLLGTLLLVYLLLSLLFTSLRKRAVFLGVGFFLVTAATLTDRVNISFPLVTFVSFGTFYFLTLSRRLTITLRELAALAVSAAVIILSLLYGSSHNFFLKTRDRVLFDSALGREVIAFYYTYSPLAAGLISKEMGVYQGLAYYDGYKNERYGYLGKGVFLSGNRQARKGADFIITEENGRFSMANRYGRSLPIRGIDRKEILGAAGRLSSMNGLRRLNTVGLYFFPAGFFLLLHLGLKPFIRREKTLLGASIGIGLVLTCFILYMSLTGNAPPRIDEASSLEVSRQGLSTAYYLFEKGEVPDSFVPAVKEMAQSDSPALRYWGAHLLGIRGDAEDADVLTALLGDPQLNVRYIAARSLYQLRKQESLPTLVTRLLTDPSWYVRCRIFSVFLKAGTIPSPA